MHVWRWGKRKAPRMVVGAGDHMVSMCGRGQLQGESSTCSCSSLAKFMYVGMYVYAWRLVVLIEATFLFEVNP